VVVLIFVGILRNRNAKKEYGFALRPLYQDLLQAAIFSKIVIIFVAIMNNYRAFRTRFC
jgi:ABC-type xylose transport system permease subunit